MIVERDLLAALDAGTLAGAAIDVVAEEPPPPGGTGAALHRHPKVVATPHLGGSTREALERIATELAAGRRARAARRAGQRRGQRAGADGPEAERVLPFLDVAYRLGRFYPQYARPDAAAAASRWCSAARSPTCRPSRWCARS